MEKEPAFLLSPLQITEIGIGRAGNSLLLSPLQITEIGIGRANGVTACSCPDTGMIVIEMPEVVISGQQVSPNVIISGQQVSPNVIISGI